MPNPDSFMMQPQRPQPVHAQTIIAPQAGNNAAFAAALSQMGQGLGNLIDGDPQRAMYEAQAAQYQASTYGSLVESLRKTELAGREAHREALIKQFPKHADSLRELDLAHLSDHDTARSGRDAVDAELVNRLYSQGTPPPNSEQARAQAEMTTQQQGQQGQPGAPGMQTGMRVGAEEGFPPPRPSTIDPEMYNTTPPETHPWAELPPANEPGDPGFDPQQPEDPTVPPPQATEVELPKTRQIEEAQGLPPDSLYELPDGTVKMSLQHFDPGKYPPAAYLNIPPKTPETEAAAVKAQEAAPVIDKMLSTTRLAAYHRMFSDSIRGEGISAEDSLLSAMAEDDLKMYEAEIASKLGVMDGTGMYGEATMLANMRSPTAEGKQALQSPEAQRMMENFNKRPPTQRAAVWKLSESMVQSENRALALNHQIEMRKLKQQEMILDHINKGADRVVDRTNAAARTLQAETDSAREKRMAEERAPGGLESRRIAAEVLRNVQSAHKMRVDADRVSAEAEGRLRAQAAELEATLAQTAKYKQDLHQSKTRALSGYDEIKDQQELVDKNIKVLRDTLDDRQRRISELSVRVDPINQLIAESGGKALARLPAGQREQYNAALQELEKLRDPETEKAILDELAVARKYKQNLTLRAEVALFVELWEHNPKTKGVVPTEESWKAMREQVILAFDKAGLSNSEEGDTAAVDEALVLLKAKLGTRK